MATNQQSAVSGLETTPEPEAGAGMAHLTVVPTNFETASTRSTDDE